MDDRGILESRVAELPADDRPVGNLARIHQGGKRVGERAPVHEHVLEGALGLEVGDRANPGKAVASYAGRRELLDGVGLRPRGGLG